MKRIRVLAEFVGFATLGLLALYGLLALCGVGWPFGLEARADANGAAQGGTIPQTMNYQGFLRNPDGTLATGPYTITARIYERLDPLPGETVFYETRVPNVTVRDGLFNVILGDDPELPADAFSDPQRYIGIELNDSGNELSPRQRLHAVPWAMVATTLVDDAPAQSVQGLSSSGDITLAPGSDLIVEGGDIAATGDLNVSGSTTVGDGMTVTGGMTVTEGLVVDGGSGLTVHPKPVLINRFENVGNDADFDTGIPADQWECVATGWAAYYDIQEAAISGNMVWTYIADSDVYPGTTTWWLHIEFCSHNDHENPDVDLLCFHKGIARWDGADRTLHTPD